MIHYYFQAGKSSSSHRLSNQGSFFQSDDEAESKELRNTGIARKRSMLPKEFDDDDEEVDDDDKKLPRCNF